MFIDTNTLEVATIQQLRRRFPLKSVPDNPSDDALDQMGFARVERGAVTAPAWNQNGSYGAPYQDGDTWRADWILTDKEDGGAAYLERCKAEAQDEIDELASTVRLSVGAKGAFVEAEYQEKESQGKAYLADPTLTAEDVPMIFAHAGTSDGATPEEVATTYVTNGGAWRLFLTQVSVVRRVAKDAVKLAESPQEIDEIIAALDWPEVAA